MPLNSGSCIGQPEDNGLCHQADLGGATKDTKHAAAEVDALKAALADLVASLNSRLGRGGYELNVEVLEGQVDVADLDLGGVATVLGPASSGGSTASADNDQHAVASRRIAVARRRGGGA